MSKKDRYDRFAELNQKEIRDQDYNIVLFDRKSQAILIAPHGGYIEPGTSEIASAIAGEKYSLYLFQGLKKRPHEHLHIASEKFDEPCALKLVASSDVAIGIHGRKDAGDPDTTWVGGLDFEIRDKIVKSLQKSGFKAEIRVNGQTLSGTAKSNICNRCSKRSGVQLEIPKSLREKFTSNAEAIGNFAKSIQKAIAQ